MSTQPRRSFRLRSSNLLLESIGSDKPRDAIKFVTNNRASLVPNPATMKSKGSKQIGKKGIVEEIDVDENDGDVEEKEILVENEAKRNVRQSRKRRASVIVEKDEPNEEEVATNEVEDLPAKTRRTGQKTEEKVMSTREKKKEMHGDTVVSSSGRPRRNCYDDLMSGSASSSDVTSSESEVDDSDLEMEIDKAKQRRGGVRGLKGRKRGEYTQESSSDSDSEEEEDDDEEEKEWDSDEPANKKGRFRSGPSSSSRNEGSRRNGGKSGKKSGVKGQKIEMNQLPVEILHDREYDVDYDEMVAWEAKSIKMVRELRELERNRANGGQIMDTVNEFIQRCLKGGRMIEMDEKESIRVTHVHENELAEMNRRKKMSVVQRIKEQVEKEKQRLEEDDEEESEDDEEDEWEEMEPVDAKEETDKKRMEVRIDTKKKLNAPWKAKWIRQEVNREVRQRCENIHKAHLVSYIAHLRHLMALAKRTTREDDGIPLSVRGLSLIPPTLVSMEDGMKMTNTMRMEKIMEWWKNNFTRIEKEGKSMEELSEIERLDELMENLHFDTSRDAAVLFSSLASHLNLSFRIVSRCVVTTKKPQEKTVESKKGATSKKKTVKKEEEEKTLKEDKIEYWCELWNKEEKTWKVFDPFLAPSERGEKKKKESKKGKQKKEKEKKDENDMVSDFVKSWNSSTHLEPYRSCMEKDGSVLYFIALDNNFCARDVSSRYINGKDLISRELKGRRANEEWLMELWENKASAWAVDTNMAKEEEKEWMEKMKKMEMPSTVAAFKDHPLYVLDKDVLKMQIIFPYDTKPIGEINKYKIYLRKFVRPINTPKWYEKMGRQIMKEEPPCGEKQVTNPMSGETGTQGLYGYWQTERWNGGEVVEGRIPRNEFGNVYLYQPEMIPRGCIYLVPEGLQRVATELSKDFVPAVIAWYYKGGTTIPLIRGAVFIKEDLGEVLDAWKVSYKRWKEEERKARSDRCIGRWKKLIKGMLRLAAMRKEFEPIQNKKKGRSLDEEAVEKEEKASWPHKKYGAEMFEDE